MHGSGGIGCAQEASVRAALGGDEAKRLELLEDGIERPDPRERVCVMRFQIGHRHLEELVTKPLRGAQAGAGAGAGRAVRCLVVLAKFAVV